MPNGDAWKTIRDETYAAGLADGQKLDAEREKEIARLWWGIGQGDMTEDFEKTWKREQDAKALQLGYTDFMQGRPNNPPGEWNTSLKEMYQSGFRQASEAASEA